MTSPASRQADQTGEINFVGVDLDLVVGGASSELPQVMRRNGVSDSASRVDCGISAVELSGCPRLMSCQSGRVLTVFDVRAMTGPAVFVFRFS
jgi:hypothetical protein